MTHDDRLNECDNTILEEIRNALGWYVHLDNGLQVGLGFAEYEENYVFGEMVIIGDAQNQKDPVNKYIENVIQELQDQYIEDREQLSQKYDVHGDEYWVAVDELEKELKNNIKASQPKVIAEINEAHAQALPEVLKLIDSKRDDGSISDETHARWTEFVKKTFEISREHAFNYVDVDGLTHAVIEY